VELEFNFSPLLIAEFSVLPNKLTDQAHGANYFFGNLQSLSYSKISQHFIETEGS
jgi:hypothetical protein